jgi:hypothetical protein
LSGNILFIEEKEKVIRDLIKTFRTYNVELGNDDIRFLETPDYLVKEQLLPGYQYVQRFEWDKANGVIGVDTLPSNVKWGININKKGYATFIHFYDDKYRILAEYEIDPAKSPEENIDDFIRVVTRIRFEASEFPLSKESYFVIISNGDDIEIDFRHV